MYVFELRRRWRQHLRYRKPLPTKQLYTHFIRNKLMSSFVLFFGGWSVFGYLVFDQLTTDVDEFGDTIRIPIEDVRERVQQKRKEYYNELSEQRKAKAAKPYHDPNDV